MKRKVSGVPSRIWSFGCLAPLAGGGIVREQLKLAHEYYNARVKIENEGREEYRVARRKFFPGFDALEAKKAELDTQIASLEDEIKGCRAKAAAQAKAKALRIVRVNPKDLQAQVVSLKAHRKALREQIKDQREKIKTHPKFLSSIESLTAARLQTFKDTRKDSGVYVGTYSLVDMAFNAAKGSKRGDPKPKRGTGIEGRVGNQINSVNCPLTTQQFLEGHPHAYIRLEPRTAGTALFRPNQWDTRSGRRSARATICIRVGSDQKRQPIWAKFPTLVHRKLPCGFIRWAWINVWKQGVTFKYELQLVIESEEFNKAPTGTGVAALCLGWRQNEDGLIVGEGADDRGTHLLCSLDTHLLTSIEYPNTLQKHADDHFNTARDVLARELKAGAAVPDWVRAEAKHLPQWRSAARLARIAGRWSVEMFPDREEVEALWREWKTARLGASRDLFSHCEGIQKEVDRKEIQLECADIHPGVTESDIRAWFAARKMTPIQTLALYLEWWRRKNKHLYQWACNQRTRSRLHRDEIFKIFASQLAKTYNIVLIRDVNWASISRRAKPESDKETPRRIRSNRQIAAPGKLEAAIVSAMGKARVEFIKYDVPEALDPDAASMAMGETPLDIARALLDMHFGGQAAAE